MHIERRLEISNKVPKHLALPTLHLPIIGLEREEVRIVLDCLGMGIDEQDVVVCVGILRLEDRFHSLFRIETKVRVRDEEGVVCCAGAILVESLELRTRAEPRRHLIRKLDVDLLG